MEYVPPPPDEWPNIMVRIYRTSWEWSICHHHQTQAQISWSVCHHHHMLAQISWCAINGHPGNGVYATSINARDGTYLYLRSWTRMGRLQHRYSLAVLHTRWWHALEWNVCNIHMCSWWYLYALNSWTKMGCLQHPFLLAVLYIRWRHALDWSVCNIHICSWWHIYALNSWTRMGCLQHPFLLAVLYFSSITCTGMECVQHPYMIAMVNQRWTREPSAFLSTSGTHLHHMHILKYHWIVSLGQGNQHDAAQWRGHQWQLPDRRHNDVTYIIPIYIWHTSTSYSYT